MSHCMKTLGDKGHILRSNTSMADTSCYPNGGKHIKNSAQSESRELLIVTTSRLLIFALAAQA